MERRIIFSQTEIEAACARIGADLTRVLRVEEKVPLALVVMKGAVFFAVDLLKKITCPIFVDYCKCSSYQGMDRSKEVQLSLEPKMPLDGRTVLVIEDVVDTGETMSYLRRYLLEAKHAKRVIIATLFDKRVARIVDVPIDYCGKVLEDSPFLMGYGLDYYELDRNVPYVYEASKEEVDRMERDLKGEHL